MMLTRIKEQFAHFNWFSFVGLVILVRLLTDNVIIRKQKLFWFWRLNAVVSCSSDVQRSVLYLHEHVRVLLVCGKWVLALGVYKPVWGDYMFIQTLQEWAHHCWVFLLPEAMIDQPVCPSSTLLHLKDTKLIYIKLISPTIRFMWMNLVSSENQMYMLADQRSNWIFHFRRSCSVYWTKCDFPVPVYRLYKPVFLVHSV